MNATPASPGTLVTPPRPVDVAAVFPQLAPLARTATRLHPRPGAPSPRDSSVGGPLLWPADEPWPHCEGPHEVDGMNLALSPGDLRLERRIHAAARGRSLTPEERETLERIRPPRELPLSVAVQPYDGSMAMLPVAQLYVRDIPDLRAPEGADLLQVLWCPFDHPIMPRTALFWRSAATVTDVLATPPEPPAVQFDGYLPEPCLLAPEQVVEYPSTMELSKELREQVGNWGLWEAAGAGLDSSYASYPEEFYRGALSVAPGWKVGGWPSWGATDPSPRPCPDCGSDMDALLTIATFEGDRSTSTWFPYENQGAEPPTGVGHFDPREPTRVQIGSGYKQQLYVCPKAPEHPHTELMQ